MSEQLIPIHNFSKDDEESIDFKFIKLETRTDYDSSVAHRHNYYEIFIFTKGGGTHAVDFSTFEIADRSVHFVSPGQVHKVAREPDSFGHIILFSREFFYSNSMDRGSLFDIPFLNNGTNEPILNFEEGEFEQVEALAEQIRTEFESAETHKEEALQSYLNLLLLQCKRKFDDAGKRELYDSTFQQFRAMLEEKFDSMHFVSDYASELGVTEKQLSAITQKAIGVSALQLIHQRIILEAKRLLNHSDHSIKEIAFFLHFDDPSHFGKFFKSKVGATPAEFRAAKTT